MLTDTISLIISGILCQNGYIECDSWAQRGECTRNPGWMIKNCAIACNNTRCDKEVPKPAGECANPLGLSWDGKGYKIPDSALYSPDNLKPGIFLIYFSLSFVFKTMREFQVK